REEGQHCAQKPVHDRIAEKDAVKRERACAACKGRCPLCRHHISPHLWLRHAIKYSTARGAGPIHAERQPQTRIRADSVPKPLPLSTRSGGCAKITRCELVW